MGLPGSGKTTLSEHLSFALSAESTDFFNADNVRAEFDDWDFSIAGRVRQAYRMKQLADASNATYVICDFVAPLVEMRQIFLPDYLVWVDTIVTSRFTDTDQVFVPPSEYNIKVTTKDAVYWADIIIKDIIK